jgi:hypothetical protein
MGLQWSNPSLFLVFAVPALASTVIMLAIQSTMEKGIGMADGRRRAATAR